MKEVLFILGVFIVGFSLGGLLMGDDCHVKSDSEVAVEEDSIWNQIGKEKYSLGHEENPIYVVHKNMCGG